MRASSRVCTRGSARSSGTKCSSATSRRWLPRSPGSAGVCKGRPSSRCSGPSRNSSAEPESCLARRTSTSTPVRCCGSSTRALSLGCVGSDPKCCACSPPSARVAARHRGLAPISSSWSRKAPTSVRSSTSFEGASDPSGASRQCRLRRVLRPLPDCVGSTPSTSRTPLRRAREFSSPLTTGSAALRAGSQTSRSKCCLRRQRSFGSACGNRDGSSTRSGARSACARASAAASSSVALTRGVRPRQFEGSVDATG